MHYTVASFVASLLLQSVSARDLLTKTPTITIDQAFGLITSEANGLPLATRSKISQRLVKNKAFNELVLWPPGPKGDELRARFAQRITKNVVDVGFSAANRLLKGLFS